MFRLSCCCIVFAMVMVNCHCALADDNLAAAKAFELSAPKTYQLKLTMRVNAQNSAVSNVIATGPVPINWPEQKVRLVSEKKSPGVRVHQSEFSGRAAMLTMQVPFIATGRSAVVERIYEITRYRLRFLLDPKKLAVSEKPSRQLRTFLAAAPGVEIKSRLVVNLAKSLRKTDDDGWTSASSFCQWIRKNVRYQGGTYRGAESAMKQRSGDCEDMTALFVAMCRTSGIPARTVWVQGHAYGEFYLETKNRQGYWIPVQLAGNGAVGEMADYRPILQKGDRIFDPIRKRFSHYVPQSARATGGRVTLSCTRLVLTEEPKLSK